ncbi:GH25 family lysozyme [Streptomyces sp. NPDC046261]|uniref:GH25 family lysozyme n=1 Tax=Streptomyces sp. NPDC046261 TaxID=3157200 RepID=UPI0033FC923B
MSTSLIRRYLTAGAGALVLAALVQPGTARAGEPAPPPPGVRAVPEDDHHAGSGLAARTGRQADPLIAAEVRGLDVSSHQGAVDWPAVAAAGASFAYVKATEGLTYKNPYFSQQYDGSAAAGLVRGAYHFARPDNSGGTVQADNFVDSGGAWTPDGKTLPGALDIEHNPVQGAPVCYGLGQSAMVDWISAFVERYHARTGRYPAIYTTTDWWAQCTGNSAAFATKSPLWIANYNGTPAPLPKGWSGYTVWQTARSGPFPGDQNVFNGSLEDLKTFAKRDYTPPPTIAWPIVRQGHKGPQVTAAQYLLNARGASLEVDGAFGGATHAAVVAFQQANNLGADGIIGPKTWQALITTVRSGSAGDAVRAAQSLLNAHGAALQVDGVFGAGTRDATVSFQRTRNLTPDGIIGPNTWQALLT